MRQKDLEIDLTDFTGPIPKSIIKFDPSYVTRYVIVCKAIQEIERYLGRKLKILDVGGYNGAARTLLPDHDITIIDVIANKKAKNYVQYAGGVMPFPSGSFDAVISCDTLEHVKPLERDEFVQEMGRVTKEFLILGAPFNTQGVADAELRSDMFYQGLTGEKSYIWLGEHRDYGLPQAIWFENVISTNGFAFNCFSHTSLNLWEIMLRTSFFLAGNIRPVDAEIAGLLYASNEEYLQKITFHDFPKNGYRTFYLGSKHYQPKTKLPTYNRKEIDLFVNQQMHITGNCIQNLTRKFGAEQEALAHANAEMEKINSENTRLKEYINAVVNSRVYKVAMGLRSISRFITG